MKLNYQLELQKSIAIAHFNDNYADALTQIDEIIIANEPDSKEMIGDLQEIATYHRTNMLNVLNMPTIGDYLNFILELDDEFLLKNLTEALTMLF